MLYVETVSSMFDLSRMTVPSNISDLFIKAKEKHIHKTRFSSAGNVYITTSRLSQTQGCFARFGAKLCNSTHDKFRQLPKRAFERHIHNIMLSIMEAEDDYIEAPILLQLSSTFLQHRLMYCAMWVKFLSMSIKSKLWQYKWQLSSITFLWCSLLCCTRWYWLLCMKNKIAKCDHSNESYW